MKDRMERVSCDQAREMDIVEYLAKLGIQPRRISGNNYWYLSPLRNEKNPSFKVNRKINRWYDFGEGCGGNIIDFAIRYNDCTVGEFLQTLASSNSSFPKHHYTPESKTDNFPEISIVKERPLIAYALIDYLQDRRIPISIADQYCREITYTLKGKNKVYYAIGFKNDCGGWELRNPYFKGSISPKDSTSIKKGKNILCVVEGFMDFLSLLTILPEAYIQYDFLILNSLTFFERKRALMESYPEVWLFLDRDNAGINTTTYAQSLSPIYNDKSELYKNHKDLNDYLNNK